MTARSLVLLLLFASPAAAQPILIPLEKQGTDRPPPVASAPPVAPPTAAPSAPSAVAEQTPTRGDEPPREEASDPSASR